MKFIIKIHFKVKVIKFSKKNFIKPNKNNKSFFDSQVEQLFKCSKAISFNISNNYEKLYSIIKLIDFNKKKIISNQNLKITFLLNNELLYSILSNIFLHRYEFREEIKKLNLDFSKAEYNIIFIKNLYNKFLILDINKKKSVESNKTSLNKHLL